MDRVFREAAAAVGQLLTELPEDAWGRPGLGSWDVRALAGHTARALTTVVDYLALPAPELALQSAADYVAAAHRVDPAIHAAVALRGVEAGHALGDDPAAGFSARVAEVEAALGGVDGDRVVTTTFGGMRLSDYLVTRTLELVIHGSDLAAATGVEVHLPDEAVAQTVEALVAAAALNGDGVRLARLMTGRDGSPLSVM